MNKITVMKERVQTLSDLLDLMDEIQSEIEIEKQLKQAYGMHWDQKRTKEHNDLVERFSFQLKSNYRTCKGICEQISGVIDL
jgi:hypothetical protein